MQHLTIAGVPSCKSGDPQFRKLDTLLTFKEKSLRDRIDPCIQESNPWWCLDSSVADRPIVGVRGRLFGFVTSRGCLGA
jgi:hypothetical protein